MTDNRPILLLTRPRDGSHRFAQAVRARLGADYDIVIAPLQRIDWIDPGPLSGVYKGVIFTSQNGVLGWNRDKNAPLVPAFCVGPQTTALARDMGLEATNCDGDAGALVHKVLAARPQTPLLHYRGVHGAGQVADRLTAAGLPTDERVVYRQVACPPPVDFVRALQSGRLVVAPLFSPKSAVAFQSAMPPGAAPLLAVISPAVANRVDPMWQDRMMVAKAPNAQAMVELVADILKRNLSP